MNVPHPIHESRAGEEGRCRIRFAELGEAQEACCANRACEAVVRDNGLACGGGERLTYELRRGLEEIPAEMRASEPRRATFAKGSKVAGGKVPRGKLAGGKQGGGRLEGLE